MFSTISSDQGTHFARQVIQPLAQNFTNILETIVFTDVLGGQAKTMKQRDQLHGIEQTAKYDYNFYDFLSDILLASNLCFQIWKSSSQVTDGLKQFSDLQLWVKLKYFSFLPASSLQKLETFGFWKPHQGKKDCLQTYTKISEHTGEL